MTPSFPTSKTLFAVSALALIATNVSHAADRQDGRLQVSGGIAMPATATAALTNPAGLVGASTALVLQAAAPDFWENGTYRAGVQAGGPSFGVAAGLENQDRAQNDPLLAYYGVAVGVPAFSLGVGGKTGISNSDGTTLNAGLLFSAGTSAHFGVTARGIDDGVNEWGAGVAIGVSSGVDVVLDAAADDDLDNLEVKPGLKVGNESAALTLSYATGPRQQFADGFTAGAAFKFASANVLEFQYNAGGDLSKYFAAFSLGF